MNTINITIFISCVILIACTHVLASDNNTKIVQHLDIAFATDHAKQKLDVFRPADNPKAPLIILIHGGGWFRGERAWTYQDAIMLAQNGYAVASLGYRRVTDYPNGKQTKPGLMWNNMKSDLMHGAQYLVDHADTLGIDASKAITMGSSAGGHLALVMRSRSAIWVKQGLVSRAPEIIGAIAHNPCSDLKDMPNSYLRTLDKQVPPEDIDPIHMTPALFKGVILVHGDADTTVPLPQSIRFIKHLTSHDIEATLAILPGVNHGYIYQLGLDTSLAPGGKWILPKRKLPPKHGQMGFDVSMEYIRQQPGYKLPYKPFYAKPPYRYYDSKAKPAEPEPN